MARSANLIGSLLLAAASAAHAADISIVNAGFEDQVFAPGQGSFATSGSSAIQSWTILSNPGSAGGGGGVARVAPGQAPFPVGVPQGAQFGYAEDAVVTQTLSTPLSSGSYLLSLYFGNPADRSDVADPARFQLFLPATGRVILTSPDISLSTLTNGVFTLFQASGSVAVGDADIGKAIAIRIVTGSPISTTGPYFAFDDVRLAVNALIVPEPTPSVLLLTGLALLVARRLRI